MMSVATFLLKGELYQVTLRRLFFFLRPVPSFLSSMYSTRSTYPLSLRASLYAGADSSNMCRSFDMSVSRLLIVFGNCWMMAGG